MQARSISPRPSEGSWLIDTDTGDELHLSCAAGRAAQEAAVAALGLLAAVLVPTIVVWAG